MSGDAVSITHEEALRLIDEHVGEYVYLGLLVTRAESESGEEGPIPFVHMSGQLRNVLEPRPARLEPDIGFYGFGRAADAFPFPPLPGKTQLRDNGIDFLIAESASIRVAWPGSSEVADHWKHPADVPRLFAEGQKARAEILEASPTDRKVAAGDDERRIWDLRLRVHPEGEPAFETTAVHGFRLSPDFEEKIERGDSITMVPEDTAEVEVLFDPLDHEQVVVRPADDDEVPKGLRLLGIVGRSLNSPDGGTPSSPLS
jgi:hypothetical protein